MSEYIFYRKEISKKICSRKTYIVFRVLVYLEQVKTCIKNTRINHTSLLNSLPKILIFRRKSSVRQNSYSFRYSLKILFITEDKENIFWYFLSPLASPGYRVGLLSSEENSQLFFYASQNNRIKYFLKIH